MDNLDPDFLKFLSSLGVGGIIAGFMFYFYRKDVRAYTEQWKGQTEALLQVVKENTTAITSNTKTIEALHARDDKVQEWLEHLGVRFTREGRTSERDKG